MILAFKLSDLITIPFGWLLGQLYHLTDNYGIAMIIFALVVQTVMVPMRAKSKKSMMKMSRLTPIQQEIQRKYAHDQQKQNEMLQKLYKDEGVSMGAGTVVMAAGRGLPKNVIGILADCGYTSPADIIKKVIAVDMHLSANLAYPFVQLGARLFGGFNIDELSPIEAVKTTKVPILFIHGEEDTFVPYEMSVQCHEANPAATRLHPIPGAGHGLAYPVDQEGYLKAAREFFSPLE